MMSVPRAWIYIRESKVELLHGYSPAEMIAQCRARAERSGATVERVILEDGKRDEFDCPGLLEAIDAAKAGEYDILVSYDQMRLTGDLAKHLWFKSEMAATSVEVQYVTAEFPNTPEGEMFETLMATFARYERVKTRMRTQNGIVGKLKKEQPIGNGVAPYGLVKQRDATGRPVGYGPDDNTFPILCRIVRDVQDRPLQAVCDGLNADGIPTPSGKTRWRPSMITSIIGNPIYTGTYRWGVIKQTPSRRADGTRVYLRERRRDDDVTEFSVPLVLSSAELDRANRAIATRRRTRRARRPDGADPFVLRGRLRCAYCQGELSCSVNYGTRRYSCLRAYGPKSMLRPDGSRCPMPQVSAEGIESVVWQAFVAEAYDLKRLHRRLTAMGDESAAAQRHAGQVASVEEEIAARVRLIEKWHDDIERFDPESVTAERAREKLPAAEREVAHLRQSLAGLKQSAPSVLSAADIDAIMQEVAALVGDVKTADAARRRALLRQFGVRVTLGVAGPDEEGVPIGTKHRYTLGYAGELPLSHSVQLPQGCLTLWEPSAAA